MSEGMVLGEAEEVKEATDATAPSTALERFDRRETAALFACGGIPTEILEEVAKFTDTWTRLCRLACRADEQAARIEGVQVDYVEVLESLLRTIVPALPLITDECRARVIRIAIDRARRLYLPDEFDDVEGPLVLIGQTLAIADRKVAAFSELHAALRACVNTSWLPSRDLSEGDVARAILVTRAALATADAIAADEAGL